ncbi:MAG: ATP-dependent DNA helicase UvrD2 [Chloroflexi bacterium]|nr:ATP-dependent DNA helicase UvrD2 [Chloroflexota bacterium]
MSDPASAERRLDGLNEAQREAASITTGPLAIIAGAGSGKTRVISHRAAYAIETGAVPTDRILLVTFTDKAATEMVERMRALGHPGVMARTFHAMALSQLRHFWPSRHDGAPPPQVIEAKWRLLAPLARRLPGGYQFTTVKDLAETIEWAKVRRIAPERWVAEGADRAPIPADLFARVYGDYERAKARAGAIDFEDMLVETVRLLETDADAAELVRARKTWFSVDEYQDTNPLAERLLELWLGPSHDLAVVGDPEQTIYSFTGATPEYLLTFAARHPAARTVALVENYRSTPEILALANRLVASEAGAGGGPRDALQATRPSGPTPTIRRFADDAGELAAIVSTVRAELRDGTDPGEIAVLVRINAQLPEIEQALTRTGIPFRVRGQRFFGRREVADARLLLRTARLAEMGPALVAAVRRLFAERLGLGAEAEAGGDEARERAASLELLVDVAQDLAAMNAALGLADLLADYDRRDAEEAAGSTAGVNLLTYHRAKGLEWDVVFLPALEEGLLPIRQAKEDDELAEERRLLYVGITRARRLLALSWAQRREGASAGGRGGGNRRPSRFLTALEDPGVRAARRVTVLPGAPMPAPRRAKDDESPLMTALRAWRLATARSDGVSAFIVAPDSLLLEIADQRPATLAALRRVKGMGPSRLARYGEELLEIVSADR